MSLERYETHSRYMFLYSLSVYKVAGGRCDRHIYYSPLSFMFLHAVIEPFTSKAQSRSRGYDKESGLCYFRSTHPFFFVAPNHINKIPLKIENLSFLGESVSSFKRRILLQNFGVNTLLESSMRPALVSLKASPGPRQRQQQLRRKDDVLPLETSRRRARCV